MFKYVLVILLFIDNSYQLSIRSIKNEICKRHYKKKGSERSWKHKNLAPIPDRVAYWPQDSTFCKRNFIETKARLLPVVRCCFRCPRGYVNEDTENSITCGLANKIHTKKQRKQQKKSKVPKPVVEDTINSTTIPIGVKNKTRDKSSSSQYQENMKTFQENDKVTTVPTTERPDPAKNIKRIEAETSLEPDQAKTPKPWIPRRTKYEMNQTPYIVLGIVGGLIVVAGTILVYYKCCAK